MTETDWAQIVMQITESSGQTFKRVKMSAVSGGCINQAWRLQGESVSWFVKLNSIEHLDMFAAELDGLQVMAATDTIMVPKPLCCGTTTSHAYLVLEYLDLNQGANDADELLGEQLAAMHRCTAARFGWVQDNTIGSTLQINTQTEDWTTFWIRQRLGFQLELAARNGHHERLQQRGQQLLSVVDQLLVGHKPQPSLLHGDLWSGNVATMMDGRSVIFDPAVYYGDREADMAMAELFGGFSPRFYQAYQAAWPLAEGYQQRKILYNLYHILNHLNLFGGGYHGQAEAMIDQLLAEVG